MQIYTAIISKNITPYSDGDMYLNDHVKVRIPNFHGPKTTEAYNLMPSGINVTPNIASDDELPWAIVSRGFDNNTFSAQSFNEDDIVSVILQNDSVNSPVIIGFASRFSYTEDPNVANNNKYFGIANIESLGGGLSGTGFSAVSGASNLAKIALAEVGYISKQSDYKLDDKTANKWSSGGAPYTKYFKEATGNACGEWCAAFCWWCYNKAGIKEHFCGGHTYISCSDIVNYYKKEGKYSTNTSNAKTGDLLFMNFDGGSTPEHIELVVEDQSGDSISTVGGNTYKDGQSSGATCVAKKTRTSYIVGIAHTGAPILQSYEGIDNSTPEGQVAIALLNNLVFDGKRINNAALSGILANIQAECSFDWTQFGDNGTSYGLCQWHDDFSTGLRRFTELKEFANKYNVSYSDLNIQVEYLLDELTSKPEYDSVKNAIINAPNTIQGVQSVAETWTIDFEVPSDKYNEANRRAGIAKNVYWPKYCKAGPIVDYIEQLFTKEGQTLSSNVNYILVANYTNKKLHLFKRLGTSNNFTQELKDITVNFGVGGISKSKGGGQNNITPQGLYSIGNLYGIGANPGINWDTNYEQITDKMYWVTDTESTHYNSIIKSPPTTKDWDSAIKLDNHQSTYQYAFIIAYNTKEKDKKKGCAVALQCGNAPTTTGSLAISSDDMLKLINALDGGHGKTQILITN